MSLFQTGPPLKEEIRTPSYLARGWGADAGAWAAIDCNC